MKRSFFVTTLLAITAGISSADDNVLPKLPGMLGHRPSLAGTTPTDSSGDSPSPPAGKDAAPEVVVSCSNDCCSDLCKDSNQADAREGAASPALPDPRKFGQVSVYEGPCRFDSLLQPAFRNVSSPIAIPTGNLDRLPDAEPDSRSSRSSQCRYVVFSEAASFAQPHFESSGAPNPRAAVMLFEGMAIRMRNDGRYSVRFTVETIPTNVELRLQFKVLREVAPIGDLSGLPPEAMPPQSYAELGTVTLPPLRFRPTSDQMSSPETLFWQISQEGYSPVVRESFDNPLGVTISRSGSVDVGSAPRTDGY